MRFHCGKNTINSHFFIPVYQTGSLNKNVQNLETTDVARQRTGTHCNERVMGRINKSKTRWLNIFIGGSSNLNITSVQLHSHPGFAVKSFGYEFNKSCSKRCQECVSYHGVHVTAPAKILKEKFPLYIILKWNLHIFFCKYLIMNIITIMAST